MSGFLREIVTKRSQYDGNDLRPIDNHHPSYKKMKCYPGLGERLTAESVGKFFVRVEPHFNHQGKFIWSHIPHGESTEKIQQVAIKFLGFEEENIIFEEAPYYIGLVEKGSLPVRWNDGKWVEVEVFKNYLGLKA